MASNEHGVSFFLNGEPVTIADPAPTDLLIDHLRSPAVGLTGAKKGCGEGGCGACTVILSRWDGAAGAPVHEAINSCLRPVCSLGGLAVTTVEGTSTRVQAPAPLLNHAPSFSRAAAPATTTPPRVAAAIDAATDAATTLASVAAPAVGPLSTTHAAPAATPFTAPAMVSDTAAPDATAPAGGNGAGPLVGGGVNPVAYRLAANNGTQCGYCTTGFVMTMSAFLAADPNRTKREIEDAFDGNICRCTGYRPILTGMKTFASDWTQADEANRMPCVVEGRCVVAPELLVPFPDGAKAGPTPASATTPEQVWIAPESLDELLVVLREHRGVPTRMVHGNTGYGVYPDEFRAARVLVDIRLVPGLAGAHVANGRLDVGSGATYAALIAELTAVVDADALPENSRAGALLLMARRTAGSIVRNAATVGGNTMLVLHHIAPRTGAPFPSDLLTVLAAVGAIVTWRDVRLGATGHDSVDTLCAAVAAGTLDPADVVLVAYDVALTPGDGAREVTLAQKVALREVNAHSVVNACTRIVVGEHDTTVAEAALVFGGVAPYPWHAADTERRMTGAPLSLDALPVLLDALAVEVRAELARWHDRLAPVPDEGFTDDYRVELAQSFLVKAVVNALLTLDPGAVPPAVRSTGEPTWGHWPVSDGTQKYCAREFTAPVAQPYVKLTAVEQATGGLRYTHEIPPLPRTTNVAVVQSRRALARAELVAPDGSGRGAGAVAAYLDREFPAYEGLVTSADVPIGGINHQGMGADQPLLADGQVSYVGQAIALVAATTEQAAAAIAEHVADTCVEYTRVDWPAPWDEPVLTLDHAIEQGSVYPDCPSTAPFVSHVWRVTRPGSRLDWAGPDAQPVGAPPSIGDATVDGAPCLVVDTGQRAGGQAHFYLETQACVVEPGDDGSLTVHPSTQSPAEMQQTVAMALGARYGDVDVRVRQLGGGYGGKTEQARFVAGPAALAAHALDRPVRLVLPRAVDTELIGKRHPYAGRTRVAIDTGAANPADRGLLRGLDVTMWGDGGAFYDCSFIVSNCIQLRTDNAYLVPNFRSTIDVCRTNTAPNTAFRAFGDVQSKVVIETAIDDAAAAIGMDPADVREKNLYARGDVTPYGQALSYCYQREVWSHLRTTCDYDALVAEAAAFNKANRWRKRGVAMLPVKYGSGYNLVMLEQATALVGVHAADGSVVIHQGGVDMGQGHLTKVTQIAAYVLGVPMELVRVESPATSVVPNPTSTGASTGTAYNGEAVKRACEELRSRLAEFGRTLLTDHGDKWCREQGVDFWNQGAEGWGADGGRMWQRLVQLANQQRVGLVVAHTSPITGGTTPVPALEYKPRDRQPSIPGIETSDATPGGAVDSFCGFTYSAACSVVEVDVLTGEVKVLSSHVMYDTGWSLNPAIDVGQVEGAFVQGVGYLLTESLVYQPDGEQRGRLNTPNTWGYKPPAAATIPLRLDVTLFPRDLAADVPENPNDLLSSKEVGEPPLVLSTSVFLAVKQAIRASRVERKLDPQFVLDAPATVQEVRRACAVTAADLAGGGAA